MRNYDIPGPPEDVQVLANSGLYSDERESPSQTDAGGDDMYHVKLEPVKVD